VITKSRELVKKPIVVLMSFNSTSLSAGSGKSKNAQTVQDIMVKAAAADMPATINVTR
jgi:hypothetical protein